MTVALSSSTNQRNLAILAFVVWVLMLGYGVVIPILPFYMDKMGAGGSELGLLVASYALMRLIFAPIWGNLSDRIGRKPVLLVGIAGYALTMLWFGLASQLWMLFAARILAGILSSAASPTAQAYIGDSTPAKERGGGMGLLGAASGLGAILGPALGGLLALSSISTPFYLASGLAFLALLLAAWLLPESLPSSARLHSKSNRSFLRLKDGRAALRGSSLGLFLLLFTSTSGLMLFSNLFGYYALRRFQASSSQVGVVLMAAGAVSTAVQALLVGRLTRRLGASRLVSGGLFFSGFVYLFFAISPNFSTMLVMVCFFSLFTALQAPALSALISTRSTASQGITMGLAESFTSLGRIAGPLVGGWLFDQDIHYPFFAGAATMLLAGLISWLFLRNHPARDFN